jgi:MPBQ/MSBQ methyltransferase
VSYAYPSQEGHTLRLIQHKKEALWFYRFVSPLYDRWVNPLFWTASMRDGALQLAKLDRPELRTLDVGAGTGFSTEGIVKHVQPDAVTMLDQSPDQLGRARHKPQLSACRKLLGDAESLPFGEDSFERYVSCGSIEYWPDPARAIAEAHRVVRPGGIALVVGPLPPADRIARLVADAWMLFPTEADYRGWFAQAGFADVEVCRFGAPWNGDSAYGIAISGRATEQGPPATGAPEEHVDEPWTLRRLLRFAAGALAGALFVPVGIVLNRRARRGR